MKQVFHFPDDCKTLNDLGGKAESLIRVASLGCNVSEGFIITSAAYNECLYHCFPNVPTSTLAHSIALNEIQATIAHYDIPYELEDQISSMWQSIGMDSVAVRSSCSQEDIHEYSSAGQYETFLGVNNLINLLESIKKVWASYWSPHAQQYRNQASQSSAGEMSILVQKMVNCESSGVLFSQDPARSTNMLIEAVWGLPVIHVKGEALPDRFVLERGTGSINKRDIGAKPYAMYAPMLGELTKVDLPQDKRYRQCVDDRVLMLLFSQAMKIEAAFGWPVDIEWGYTNGVLFVFQVRPITTQTEDDQFAISLPNSSTENPPELILEVEHVPAPMCQFMTSFFVKALPTHPFFPDYRFMDGYLYYAPRPQPPSADGRHIADMDEGTITRAQSIVDKWEDDSLVQQELWLAKFIGSLPPQYDADAWKLCFDELVEGFSRGWTKYIENWNAFQQLSYYRLPDLLSLLPSTIHSDVGLLHIYHWNNTRQRDQELWELGRMLKENSDNYLMTRIRECDYESLCSTLRAFDWGISWQKKFDKLLRNLRYHSMEAFDIRWPSYGEDATPLLKAILMYADSSLPEPRQVFEGKVGERDIASAKIRNALPAYARKGYGAFLRASSIVWRLLDDDDELLMMIVHAVRRYGLLLGTQLSKDGILPDSSGLFYLDAELVLKYLEGEVAAATLRHQSLLGRQRYDKFVRRQPPNRIVGGKLIYSEAIEELKGEPCCAGRVTGDIRVCTSPQEFVECVQPDEIVATRGIPSNASITIPFLKGLILESGGITSHPAIIAREYHIPTIVGVTGVTSMLKTGQRITMDGKEGRIIVHR